MNFPKQLKWLIWEFLAKVPGSRPFTSPFPSLICSVIQTSLVLNSLKTGSKIHWANQSLVGAHLIVFILHDARTKQVLYPQAIFQGPPRPLYDHVQYCFCIHILCLHDAGFALQIRSCADSNKHVDPWNPIVISGMRGLSPKKISQPCHFEDCLATGEILNNRGALFVFCQRVAAVWAGRVLFKTNQGSRTCFVSNLPLSHFLRCV